MSRKQTDNRFWRIKKGEPIPEWLQKGATVAGVVAGDDLIVILSETEGYDVYLADPNSSRPMMKVTAENMPEDFLITGAPTCFHTTSSLHYTIGTLQKENEALADALRGLLQAYKNAFDWADELTPETAEAERIANEVLEAFTPSRMEQVPSEAEAEAEEGK